MREQIFTNFPLILIILTAVSGLIWLIDSLFFKRARTGRDPFLVDYAASFFPVLLIVLVLRSFIFEPFRIPSGSMIPTLLVGDFILVSKFSYGLRLPVVHTKILDTGEPIRGDVAVFRYPNNPKQDYIKRVVGLPGDTIAYREKTLYINGEKAEISGGEPYVPAGSGANYPRNVRFEEQLGEVAHDILVSESTGSTEQVWEVPEGHYFMVGDNRDNSADSRSWGFVPEENLVGRAKYVWMHWSDGILWNRLGNKIE